MRIDSRLRLLIRYFGSPESGIEPQLKPTGQNAAMKKLATQFNSVTLEFLRGV